VSIVADRVVVVYPGSPPVEAIRGVSFTVDSGEFVTIVGPSGSGKTSLLHVLGGILPPTAGRVFLDGEDLDALGERERNRIRAARIGFVFQEPYLLEHRIAVDNVSMGALYRGGSPRQRRRDAHAVLEKVGIDQLALTAPNRLSGGERQRVGIARALMGDPSVILCDEPTGNLDSDTSLRVVRLLDNLREQGHLTVVVVTHDPEVQRASNRSTQLRDGRIVA
jgi:putative ABC transport system ATP-binding protein